MFQMINKFSNRQPIKLKPNLKAKKCSNFDIGTLCLLKDIQLSLVMYSGRSQFNNVQKG